MSSFLVSSSGPRMLTPVMLPPGLAKLAINPASTRSQATATIGIAVVA